MREKLIELLRCEKRCPKSLEHCGEDCPYFDISKAYCCDEDSATADMLIANGVTVQQWVPVSERLPADDIPSKMYLCFWNGMIRVCKYWRTQKCFKLMGKNVKVTHWMPLPTPPKEG
jgi:hypothetical protein